MILQAQVKRKSPVKIISNRTLARLLARNIEKKIIISISISIL